MIAKVKLRSKDDAQPLAECVLQDEGHFIWTPETRPTSCYRRQYKECYMSSISYSQTYPI